MNMEVKIKFNESIKIPFSAKDLLLSMMNKDENERPTINEILSHEFF